MSEQSHARHDAAVLERLIAERDRLRAEVEAEQRRRERILDALQSLGSGELVWDFGGWCVI